MDQNIMRVLELVQDGKITAEEAERLIAAMSGKSKASGAGSASGAASSGATWTGAHATSGRTATLDPPAPKEVAYQDSPEAVKYARSFGLPTGELLQQIADDPSIPEHDKLAIIINATSLLCAVFIVQPIPLADFFILTPIQVAGVLAMSQVMGQPLGKNGAGEMVTSIAAIMGGGILAQQLMYVGVKTFAPIIGGIAIIPVVYGATYGLMTASRAILEARRSDQQLSDDEIRRIKVEAEQRAKAEKRDWSPGAIMSDLETWRVKGEAYKQYELLFTEEQNRLRPLQEQVDALTPQVIALATRRMDLEQKVRDTGVQLTDVSDEERPTVQAERDRLQSELDAVQAHWSRLATELESRQADLTQTTQRLEQTLTERFGNSYPNVRLASGLFVELMRLPFTQLIQAERQISLLQFDPVKVNYLHEPFYDANGQEIRKIAVDNEIRLYTASQGSTVFVRALGTHATEADDMARLKA